MERLVRLTGLAPHRQVLVLLDVQHQLQAVPHPALHSDQQIPAVLTGVKCVAFSIAGEDLSKQEQIV